MCKAVAVSKSRFTNFSHSCRQGYRCDCGIGSEAHRDRIAIIVFDVGNVAKRATTHLGDHIGGSIVCYRFRHDNIACIRRIHGLISHPNSDTVTIDFIGKPAFHKIISMK